MSTTQAENTAASLYSSNLIAAGALAQEQVASQLDVARRVLAYSQEVPEWITHSIRGARLVGDDAQLLIVILAPGYVSAPVWVGLDWTVEDAKEAVKAAAAAVKAAAAAAKQEQH